MKNHEGEKDHENGTFAPPHPDARADAHSKAMDESDKDSTIAPFILPIRLSDKILDAVSIDTSNTDLDIDPEKMNWIKGILNHVLEYLVEVNPPELHRELPSKLDMMNIIREYNTLRELRVVFNYIFQMTCRLLNIQKKGLFLVNNPGTGFFELVLGYGFESRQYKALYEEMVPHLQEIEIDSLYRMTVMHREQFPQATQLHIEEATLIVIPLSIDEVLWGELVLFTDEAPEPGPMLESVMRVVFETSASVIRTTVSGRMPYELTFTDNLTGTYNYGLWWKRLDEELKRARRRDDEQVTLIVFDVDNFNRINQSHGYFIGDQFLRIIADHIKLCVRGFDIVGRIGGEEFGVVLIGADKPNSLTVAERILESVAGIPDETRIKLSHTLTLSGGIAGYPEDTDMPEEMVEMAKTALVSAKIMGGNRIKVYEQEE